MENRSPQARATILRVLRGMTPEQRFAKAMELPALARELFEQGLRTRFPQLSEHERHQLLLDRLEKCHNRTC